MSAPQSCGVNPAREAELEALGWQRQTTIDEPRLSELVKEYQVVGFEIHLETFDRSAKGEGVCNICFNDAEVAKRFKTIYTRPVKTNQDDLFTDGSE